MILIVIFLQTHTLTSLAFALWLFHNRGHCIKVAVSIFMKQNRTNFHVNSMMLANRTPNRMLNEHHPPTKKPHNLRWRRRRRARTHLKNAGECKLQRNGCFSFSSRVYSMSSTCNTTGVSTGLLFQTEDVHLLCSFYVHLWIRSRNLKRSKYKSIWFA